MAAKRRPSFLRKLYLSILLLGLMKLVKRTFSSFILTTGRFCLSYAPLRFQNEHYFRKKRIVVTIVVNDFTGLIISVAIRFL